MKQVKSKIWECIEPELRYDIFQQINAQITSEIWFDAWDQISDKVWNQISDHIWNLNQNKPI